MRALKNFTSLCVISYVTWLAKDLGANQHLPVKHSLGLDLRTPPGTSVEEYAKATAFWAPMPNAARLITTTGHNPFTTPGPTWLPELATEFTHRNVTTYRVGELKTLPRLAALFPAHIKPADVKIGSLPARVYTTADEFLHALTAVEVLPDNELLQVSDPVDYVTEVRCFITSGHVTASSVYLHQGQTWDAWTQADAPDPAAGVAFAQTVAQTTPGPPGYVLDVGQDRAGKWTVVEANPAWSSNPYHSHPDGVVESICAAQTPTPTSKWAWTPAPFLTPQLRRPLPVLVE